MMIAVDDNQSLLLGGSGDIIEPDDGVLSIGSGSGFATAAARALINNTEMEAEEIVEKALKIAGEICIYTNSNITIETL
jgi:ATP-dependent HslUV protease subunit HslV